MKLNKFFLLTFLFIFVTILSTVSAQPPAVFSGDTVGYTLVAIEPPVSIANNTAYEIHIHVLNNSNSKIVNSSITCMYHLEKPNGTKISEGLLALTTSSTITNLSYTKIINAGNFTTNGLYNLLVQCYDNGQVSGITRMIVDVTYGGSVPTTALIIWYSIAVIFLFVFMIMLMKALGGIPDGNPRDEYGEIIGISHLKYLRLPIYGAIYFLLLAINFIISTVARYYLNDNLITKVFWAFFNIQMKLAIPIVLVVFGWLIIEAFRDKNLQQLMKRGLPTK